MKPVTNEKRIKKREVIHQVVCFETSEVLSDTLTHRTSSGRAIDISSEGMGIITQQRLHAGDVVTIRYPIHGMKTSLPVFAQVKWLENDDDENIRAGLSFLS
jgi:hypothetical protein